MILVSKDTLMQIKTISPLRKQYGAATLLTAIILLIATTLVTFITAKTVLMETKMASNNYRAAQALANADAAMNFAIAYFNGDGSSIAGLDHDTDTIRDDIDGDVDVDSVGGGHHDINTFFTTIVFDNNDGTCTSANSMKSALITVTGTSDDGIASRTISQCVGTRNLLDGGGPDQTLVSGSTVGLTGSAQIINRYTDMNVWSASTTAIGSSSAMSTYIRPTNMEIEDFIDPDDLIDTTTSPSIPNAQKVSSNGLGSGTDLYFNDPRLAVSGTSFFDLFFLNGIDDLAGLADNNGQKLDDGASNDELDTLSGIIFVDGDASSTATGTTIGSSDSPAILIVDGDFSFSGGTITGLVYVTGNTTITGNPNTVGTMISKGSVSGNGTLTLVYSPNTGSGSKAPLKGTTGIVAGSWRDW